MLIVHVAQKVASYLIPDKTGHMKGRKKGTGELESTPQQTETIFELAVDVRAFGEGLQGGADEKIF